MGSGWEENGPQRSVPGEAPRPRTIDVQRANGGPAGGCQAHEPWSTPAEMFAPTVAPRMVKWNDLARLVIVPGKVRPFAPIAPRAGPRQVPETSLSAVLNGDDVIALKG